ncbi:MAG: hypothetical protein HYZ74_01235 [Elusimicrobia bacterium]|nr:hypothetical protein [Elusimicrobiota bacterium]
MMTGILEEELVIEKAPAEPQTKDLPKEEVDISRLPKRAPPSKGLCVRCGENKPINRLMLCYPCWVKTRLEKDGWKEGQPHPESCGCSGLGAHPELRSEGN